MSILRDIRPFVLVTAALWGCGEAPRTEGAPASVAVETPASVAQDAPALAPLAVDWATEERQAAGDARRGKELVVKYECNRCHAGTGDPPPSFDRQCAGCHKRIKAKSLPFPREKLDAWSDATHHFIDVPTLERLGATVRASWIAGFLVEPQKVRLHEEEWMPRLRITAPDARDMAAYLTRGAPEAAQASELGDAIKGGEVVARKGCLVCHTFRGAKVPDAAMGPFPALSDERLSRAIALAPDLGVARARVRPDVVVAWIQDPRALRPETLMPTLGLSEQEARDAAAFVLQTPLAPQVAPAAFKRLPILERRVTYEEVATRVFRTSCTHCHADPSPSADPGPGSAGGFGFAPRGVQLLSYAGTQRGYRDARGARHSLFDREPELEALGGSRLVAALVARHEETAGRPEQGVRGMPLGLPGLSAEEIQLVETWVSQGARP